MPERAFKHCATAHDRRGSRLCMTRGRKRRRRRRKTTQSTSNARTRYFRHQFLPRVGATGSFDCSLQSNARATTWVVQVGSFLLNDIRQKQLRFRIRGEYKMQSIHDATLEDCKHLLRTKQELSNVRFLRFGVAATCDWQASAHCCSVFSFTFASALLFAG